MGQQSGVIGFDLGDRQVQMPSRLVKHAALRAREGALGPRSPSRDHPSLPGPLHRVVRRPTSVCNTNGSGVFPRWRHPVLGDRAGPDVGGKILTELCGPGSDDQNDLLTTLTAYSVPPHRVSQDFLAS